MILKELKCINGHAWSFYRVHPTNKPLAIIPMRMHGGGYGVSMPKFYTYVGLFALLGDAACLSFLAMVLFLVQGTLASAPLLCYSAVCDITHDFVGRGRHS